LVSVSRLDSFIRRLEAQRACLDWAVAAVRDLDGPALEIGLGNGRTYDHLRARFGPGRGIFALDRQLAAHPGSVPDKDHLILGEFRDSLPALARRLGPIAALVHADTGSGNEAASRAQAQWLAGPVDALLAPGGVVVSDQDMSDGSRAPQGWRAEPLPAGVQAGRYFIYRKAVTVSGR
jgi:hypothetical protein